MCLNPRDEAGSMISCGGPRHFQLFRKSVTTASLSESSQNDWFAMHSGGEYSIEEMEGRIHTV